MSRSAPSAAATTSRSARPCRSAVAHGRPRRSAAASSNSRADAAPSSARRGPGSRPGRPAPELQAWVGGDGVIGRADFLWRRYATVGEADGAVKYASPGRAISQLRRDASLRAAGFQVVHFTWEEIVQVPGQVAASIRAAFRRGGTGS
jgi:hypothetical protein